MWLFTRTSQEEGSESLLKPNSSPKTTSWIESGSLFGHHSEKNRRQKLKRFACILIVVAIGVTFGIVMSVYFSRRNHNIQEPQVVNSSNASSTSLRRGLILSAVDPDNLEKELDFDSQMFRRLSEDDCTNQYSVVWMTTVSRQRHVTLQYFDCDGNLLETEKFLGRRSTYSETDYFCVDGRFDGTFLVTVSASTVLNSVSWTMYNENNAVLASGGAPANVDTCSGTSRPSAQPSGVPTHLPSSSSSPSSSPTAADTVGVSVSFDLEGAAYSTPTEQDVADIGSILETELLGLVDSAAEIKKLKVTSSATSSSSVSRRLSTYIWITSFKVEVSMSASEYATPTQFSDAVQSATSSSEVSSGITSASIGGGVSLDETSVSTVLLTQHPSPSPTSAPDPKINSNDDTGSSTDGSASSASIGFIVGALIAAVSVIYCASLHRKFLTCQSGGPDGPAREVPRSQLFLSEGTRRQQAISSKTFQEVRFAKGSDTDLDPTCAICICDMEDADTVKQLPNCNHCYHSDCLDEWLRRSRLCPLCKQDVVPRETAMVQNRMRRRSQQLRAYSGRNYQVSSSSSNLDFEMTPPHDVLASTREERGDDHEVSL